MSDLATKALLCAIALGVWTNVLVTYTRPAPAYDVGDLRTIEDSLASMRSNIDRIAVGHCGNAKMC